MHSLDHLLSDRRLTAALLLCSSAQAESLIEMVKSNAAGRLVLTLGGMDQAHWTARYVFPACFMACFAVCSTNLYTKQTPVRRSRPLWTLAPAIPDACLAVAAVPQPAHRAAHRVHPRADDAGARHATRLTPRTMPWTLTVAPPSHQLGPLSCRPPCACL